MVALFSLLFSLCTFASIKPGSVIYGVVPCIFGNACFKDVIHKLPYLQKQGVDVLWISPIYESDDPSHISYAVTDYFKIRPDFGTDEEFKELVKKSHDLGMKVILDFVPNHTSIEHPFIQSAMDQGESSPYYHFYDRDENGDYTFYFDWENLPNLNFSHPLVRDHITKAFIYWVEKFDVDGYRVDAAWGIKERNPEFWSELITTLKKKKKDLIMLAEAGARDEYYFQNGFDFAYDWTTNLGEWSWQDVFQSPEQAPSRLHAALMSSSYKNQIARFINNNDTGERFISRYGLLMTRLAAVIQHTVPGIPVVYMGDETGAEFDPYEDPDSISWNDPHNLKVFYQKLASIRETFPALHSGDFQRADAGDVKAVYAFKRTFKDSSIYVITNFSQSPKMIKLNSLDDDLYHLSEGCKKSANGTIKMQGVSFHILVSDLKACQKNQF